MLKYKDTLLDSIQNEVCPFCGKKDKDSKKWCSHHERWECICLFKYKKTNVCSNGLVERRSNPEIRFESLKKSAMSRKKEVNLTYEDYLDIISLPCVYCGTLTLSGGGVDRVNSKKGYNINNCVSCCYICNSLKYFLNVEVFLKQCAKVAKHLELV